MSTKIAAPAKPVPTSNGRGQIAFVGNGTTLVVPAEAHRHEEFRRWARREDFPPNVRVFYDRGALAFDMSNEEIQTHNEVKLEITRVLSSLVHDADTGKFYGDGILVSHEAAEVSNNPDALFVRWETFDAGRARLVEREGAAGQYVEVEGTPDWVLEVVSLSSVTKDTVNLRQAYHRAGISEYWLVDARGEEVDFQVLLFREARYVAAPRKAGWQKSRVFDRWFRLERERGRRGLWRYTLRAREE